MSSTQPNYDRNEVQNRAQQLQATLKDANLNIKVHALLEMLDECLPICPVELLDEQIFALVLSNACQLNLKVINEIYNELDNSTKDLIQIKTKLTICQSLLDCWQKSLAFIKQFERFSVSKIKVLISSLLDVTKANLENCKTSEQRYASCREQVAGDLKNLFRKAIIILKELFVIFNERVTLDDCSDTEVLIQALDQIGEIASLIKELDLNSSIDLWKHFGKLAVKHESEFKQIGSAKILTHFQQMSSDIISLLPSILQQRPSKMKEKLVTYLTLLFKILIKLCNTYKDIVSDRELILFVELLVQIECHSPCCLTLSEVDFNIIKQIELNILYEVETFLEVFLQNDSFVQVFFKYKKKHEKEAIGYYLLILDIMKYLAKQEYDLQKPWISGTNSVLNELLSNIDLLNRELCISKLRLSKNDPKLYTLYEATLITSYSLIYQIPASDFNAIELLMLKYLLCGQLWASLFSSDLWCFISRIGSPQLCFDHVKFLISVYEEFWQRKSDIEIIVLFNLIGRLYSKLSDKHKELILNDFENMNSKVKCKLSQILSEKSKTELERKLLLNGINIPVAYQMVCNLPTVDHWNNFIHELSNFGLVNVKWNDESTKTISELWSKSVKMISDECQGTSLNLLSDLIETLFHISRIQGNNIPVICSILKSILEAYLHMTPVLRIKTCHYLKHNACYFTSSDNNLVQWLAKLYCCLLEDNVPIIKQEALESFDQFVQTCPNDDLINRVTKVIVNRTTICEFVRAYITHESYYKNEFASLDEYIKNLVCQKANFQEHTCYQQDERKRDDKFPRLESSDHSSASSLDSRIDFVCKEILEIAKHRNQLNDESMDKLRMTLLKVINSY